MLFAKNPAEHTFLKKLGIIFAALFLAQFVLGGLLIYQVALKETTSMLANITKRVIEDVSYQNGTWDTNRYDADPELPGTYPLYVIGADGYVVDRWKPLHGFLDTSDTKRLLSYTTPQTISADNNQPWRVFSKQILSSGQKIGVLTVAYFNPTADQLTQVDAQLENNGVLLV